MPVTQKNRKRQKQRRQQQRVSENDSPPLHDVIEDWLRELAADSVTDYLFTFTGPNNFRFVCRVEPDMVRDVVKDILSRARLGARSDGVVHDQTDQSVEPSPDGLPQAPQEEMTSEPSPHPSLTPAPVPATDPMLIERLALPLSEYLAAWQPLTQADNILVLGYRLQHASGSTSFTRDALIALWTEAGLRLPHPKLYTTFCRAMRYGGLCKVSLHPPTYCVTQTGYEWMKAGFLPPRFR
jgi:hypothetical protein